MPLPNSNIKKQSGLKRLGRNADNVSAFCAPGVATSGGGGTTALALGQWVQLNSILDAQGYGLNTAYDTANSILVYRHIYKFFKRCPGGTLYLMLVPQRLTLVAAVGASVPFMVGTGAVLNDTLMLAVGAINLFAAAITLAAGSTTATATAIVAAINAYTATSGCTAVLGSGGAYTVTLPASLGALGNGITPVITKTGTVVVTATVSASGVTQVGTIPIVAGVAATAAYNVTTGAAASDTWNSHIGTIALLAAPLTLGAGSTTVTATAIIAAINAYTATSGCTAVLGSGGAFTVTLPVSAGATQNTVVPSITETGTIVCTATAVTGGVTAVTTQAMTQSLILDSTQNYAAYLLRAVLSSRAAAGLTGAVRQLATALNPDTAALAAETSVSGISDDTQLAVAKAQALATYAYAAFYPVDIVVEGRKFTGTPTNAFNMRGLGSGQVSCVIGSDPAIYSMQIGSAYPYQYYAEVGDALGCMAQASVDQSIGDPNSFNLTDTSDSTFLTAGLSSGQTIDNYSAGTLVGSTVVTGLDTLYDKGYIFPHVIVGLPGFYWGGAPTCAAITADAAFVENSRTINKASILLRNAFLLSINTTIPVDVNGAILPTKVAQMQDAAEKMLDQYMTNVGEISGRSVQVITTDSNSNPINFVQSGEVIPYIAEILINGVARQISGTVALVSALS